jgi:hypothetical protein
MPGGSFPHVVPHHTDSRSGLIGHRQQGGPNGGPAPAELVDHDVADVPYPVEVVRVVGGQEPHHSPVRRGDAHGHAGYLVDVHHVGLFQAPHDVIEHGPGLRQCGVDPPVFIPIVHRAMGLLEEVGDEHEGLAGPCGSLHDHKASVTLCPLPLKRGKVRHVHVGLHYFLKLIVCLISPLCSTSTLSPYFLGASFPAYHLRAST